MFNRQPFLAGIAFMAMSAAGLVAPAPAEEAMHGHGGYNPARRLKRGKGKDNRRGTGVQAKPAKKTNMVRMSKRVRRKHRRAA